MAQYQYTVVFEPAEEGGYLAHVPILNGITTHGKTKKEAIAMVREAIEVYIETALAEGIPIPREHSTQQLAVSI